ncbi:MAG TPA: acetylxylan esterase [Bryobacteraceae bacterium]|nr:acetylxylan esterase [Bryobacteraceae bacterium]
MTDNHFTRRDCLLLLAACAPATAQNSEALDFLHGLSEYENIHRMLPDFMEREAQARVTARKNTLKLRNAEDVTRRGRYVRERILQAIGGLPERTPLNPRTISTVERQGYRIEKIVFESQPNFYVTANLYLPAAGKAPYPAVLYPLGHELGGKANSTWQQMLATLARKGYVALTWDPVGQGERVQIYDADLQDSKLRGSTTEHTIQGIQCLLTGHHIARYTIFDGLRALDYLLSRKEVDPERVICTGNSGGGTHTAYLSALDDRIKVAAPSCYITSWHWMLKTLGPQDAEQVFPGWLADGLDYPDFIYAAAPKPYLMLSAIRDFFPIDGARESFAEAKAVYAALEQPDKLQMVEADDGHGYSQPRRLAAYEWFARWTKSGGAQPATEVQIQPESPQTLDCTPTGQVASSLGGETVLTLNRARAGRLRQNRPAPEAATLKPFQEKVRRAAMTRSGYTPRSGPVPVTPYGTIKREGYAIEKLVYESEPGIFIPALLYMPAATAQARRRAVIVVDGAGKSAAAKVAHTLASSGKAVLSIDPRGMGETKAKADLNDTESYRYFGDYENAMTAILLRRTLAGMRAQDIIRGIDLLAARPDVDPAGITGLGRNAGAVPLLYAAVFDPRLRSLALEHMLISYDAVVANALHKLVFDQIVPGALMDFDLPDLIAAVAPRPVSISDPVSPVGMAVPPPEFAKAYTAAARAFQLAGAPDALRLRPPRPEEEYAGPYYRELFGIM